MNGSLILFSELIMGVKDKDIGIPSFEEISSFKGITSVEHEM